MVFDKFTLTLFFLLTTLATVNSSSTHSVSFNVGKEESISAKCNTPTTLSAFLSHFFSLLPPMAVVLLLAFVSLVFFYFYCIIFESEKIEKKEKEVIHQSEQCNPDFDDYFMYKIIYRVGCLSAHFNRENGWVEFQLMKSKKLPFNEAIR